MYFLMLYAEMKISLLLNILNNVLSHKEVLFNAFKLNAFSALHKALISKIIMIISHDWIQQITNENKQFVNLDETSERLQAFWKTNFVKLVIQGSK